MGSYKLKARAARLQFAKNLSLNNEEFVVNLLKYVPLIKIHLHEILHYTSTSQHAYSF